MDRALAVMLSAVKHEEVEANSGENISHKATVGPRLVDAVSSVVVRRGVSESVNFGGEWKPLITDVRSLNVKRSKSDPAFREKMELPKREIVYSEDDDFSRSFDAFPENQRDFESYVTRKETAAESLSQISNLFQTRDRQSGSHRRTGWKKKNGNKSDRAHSKWSDDGTTAAAAYSCRYCEKRFSNAFRVKRHEMIHTGEKPYSCANCEKRFTQKCDMNRHMQRHTGEKVFACIQCYKRFATKYDLAQHAMVHSGIKRYVCSQCDKRFLRRKSLMEHVKRHSGEKPHSCLQCSKQFAIRRDLVSHKIVHSAEKPHGCPSCRKRFFTLSRLKRHSRRHLVEKPSKCRSCGKKVALEREVMAHDGDILDECQCCDKVLETPTSQLEKRLQTATNGTSSQISDNDGNPPDRRPYCMNELPPIKSSKRSAFPDGNLRAIYFSADTTLQIGDDELIDSSSTEQIRATDDKQFVDCSHPVASKLILCSDAAVSCDDDDDDDDNGCDPSATRTDSPSSSSARFPAGGAKPYVCENCPSWFSEAGQLLQHSLTHDVKTSYECEECRTRFADYGRLLWHMLVHGRENRG